MLLQEVQVVSTRYGSGGALFSAPCISPEGAVRSGHTLPPHLFPDHHSPGPYKAARRPVPSLPTALSRRLQLHRTITACRTCAIPSRCAPPRPPTRRHSPCARHHTLSPHCDFRPPTLFDRVRVCAGLPVFHSLTPRKRRATYLDPSPARALVGLLLPRTNLYPNSIALVPTVAESTLP